MRGEAQKTGEMGLVCDGFIVHSQPGEVDLRSGKAGGGQVDRGVLAGGETVLDDGDEMVCKALLLLEDGLPLEVAIESEIGDSGIFGDGLTNVFQRERGCFERGLRGADVVALRVAEDKRLRVEVVDGGLAKRESIGGRADGRGADNVWDVCVFQLLEGGSCFVYVGLGGLYLRTVLQSQSDRAGERYLRDGGSYRTGQGRARDQLAMKTDHTC